MECLHYALHLPTSVVITGIDSLATFGVRRVRPFKTSSIFDSTAQHPEWLGEEPARKRSLMPAG